MSIPNGNVTFLFTDIEGSTKLAQDFPDSYDAILQKHNSILHKAVESCNGFVFDTIGDAFCCAFENADDAVRTAVEAQLNLSSENWEEGEIKVRIGIHSGIAEWNGNRYMGYITLARTSRVMSAGHGGQIIVSNNTYELIKGSGNESKVKSYSFRDLGERRLKDVIHPLRLFQAEFPGLRSDFPPLKTLDSRPNNLPVQLTNFIGREKEISEIKIKISDCRLMTLIGPGGTGKTRLSMQIAAELIDEFTNGVWLVEFAPVSDQSLVPLTIARSLGINIPPGHETESSLINFLKDKELLIILDNCEHLITECTRISEKILKNCSKLKIIATSREAMRCEGEVTVKVLSLAHPEPSQKNTPQELSQFEAVRLFIERALAVNPNFRVNNDNAPALAQICYHLDGIPLAIELAAARIKVLTVEQICEKLDDRFRLLTGGKRTALPRQQTLRALIDWSYDLLNEKEKSLFQSLSVFSGGWTLESAEEVCSDKLNETYEILDIHSNLLDKSLINSTEVSGEIRFDMLESIKQYAKEKLTAKKEVEDKHFEYFKKLSNHHQMIKGAFEQNHWIKLIDTELNNVRTAIQWGTENKPEEVCDLINDISQFWVMKGYFLEGLQTCLKFLDADLSVSEFQKGKVLYSASLMETDLGNMHEAEKLARESLEIFRKSENKFNIANCLNVLGAAVILNVEKTDEAMTYYEESLSIFRELGFKKEIALLLYNISFASSTLGDKSKSYEYKLEALNIFKSLNETHNISSVLANLGVHEFKNGNFEKAREYTEESLSNSYKTGDNFLISANLINLGCIYSGLNQYDKAVELLEKSVEIIKEFGFKSNYIVAAMYLGEFKSKLGDEPAAIKFFKESILTGDETGIDYYLGNNFYNLGISYYNLKDFENSLKYFSFLKIIAEQNNNPIGPQRLEKAFEYKNKLKGLLDIKIYEKIMIEILKLNKQDALQFAIGNQKFNN